MTSAEPFLALKRYFTGMMIFFIASFLLFPSAKAVNNLYYALLALPAVGVLACFRGRLIKYPPGGSLWLAFFVWVAGAAVLAESWTTLKHLFYVLIFVFVCSQFVQAKELRHPSFVRLQFWAAALYIAGSALFYWYSGRYAPGEQVLWLPSRMDGPNFTSMWLSSCYALLLPSLCAERRWRELVLATILAAFCLLYVLQSRSGIVTFLFASAAVAFWKFHRTPRHLAGILLGTAILVALIWLAATHMPQIGKLFSRGDSLRFEIWTTLWREWLGCGWLLGCGPGHTSSHILSSGGPIFHPHNIYLAMGLFFGFPALLLFLAVLAAMLRRAWQHGDAWGLYLVTALIGLAFDGSTVIDNPDERWLLIWLPAALIANTNGRGSGGVARA